VRQLKPLILQRESGGETGEKERAETVESDFVKKERRRRKKETKKKKRAGTVERCFPLLTVLGFWGLFWFAGLDGAFTQIFLTNKNIPY